MKGTREDDFLKKQASHRGLLKIRITDRGIWAAARLAEKVWSKSREIPRRKNGRKSLKTILKSVVHIQIIISLKLS